MHVWTGKRGFIILVNFFSLIASFASGGMICRPGVGSLGRDDGGVISIVAQISVAVIVWLLEVLICCFVGGKDPLSLLDLFSSSSSPSALISFVLLRVSSLS